MGEEAFNFELEIQREKEKEKSNILIECSGTLAQRGASERAGKRAVLVAILGAFGLFWAWIELQIGEKIGKIRWKVCGKKRQGKGHELERDASWRPNLVPVVCCWRRQPLCVHEKATHTAPSPPARLMNFSPQRPRKKRELPQTV